MTAKLSRAMLNERLADGNCDNNAGLQQLPPVETMNELPSTHLDGASSGNDHQPESENNGPDRAILEAIEVDVSQGKDESNAANCNSETQMEHQQNELDGKNHDE